MKRILALVLGVAGVCLGSVSARAESLSMDHDWKFSRGDFAGAERGDFDDAAWRTLDVPHDWGIEGPFDRMNPAGGAGAFLPAGLGWYRKRFKLPADISGKRIFIEFDGVMENSDVWINDTHLGRRPFGYVGFQYELPEKSLKFGDGASNVLAVRCNNADQPGSRWYTGSGIYRHVRLLVLDQVHFDRDGIFVTTPKVSAEEAVVHVQGTVVNQSDMEREITVDVQLAPDSGGGMLLIVGASKGEPLKVAPHQSAVFQGDIAVSKPSLWSLEHPRLYIAMVSLREASGMHDRSEVSFGIRDAHFDADTGFWLNGRNIKIKGVCLHADGSAFGAAVPLDVWEHRLKILKGLGANAIRTAHNPPSPEFLDLCDRMGFLVMDEMFDCWTVAKNIGDYHLYFEDWSKIDTRDTVRRDRNHPSVILYSAGNEIHDTPDAELSKRILSGLVEVFHENDPTRPVTQALLRPNATHDYDDGLTDLLDVVGTNYRDAELLAAHDAKPARRIINTEEHHDRQAWLEVRDHPALSGQFLWAGIDYLGESPLWPLVSSRAGLIDRVGTPHPLAYERQSWWSDQPVVHIVRRTHPPPLRPGDFGYTPGNINYRLLPPDLFADWTPANLSAHDEDVEVYSNCERVELFLNGRSLGSQPLHADASARTWKVAFSAGGLKAVAFNHGQAVATDELRTAGKPAKIILVSDKATIVNAFDWDRVAVVTASVVDANGVIVPNANDLINFKTNPDGAMIAVDSGDHTSHEPFHATERHAYQGRCCVFLGGKAAGGITNITLAASAPGLEGAQITLAEAIRTRQ